MLCLPLGELNEKKGLTTDAIKFYLAAADSLAKGGLKEKLLAIYEKIIALIRQISLSEIRSLRSI